MSEPIHHLVSAAEWESARVAFDVGEGWLGEGADRAQRGAKLMGRLG